MRIHIPRVHGETPREKLFRTLLLLLVFAAVIWAFAMNNERIIDRLNMEGAVYDETGVLDKDQKKYIVSFTHTLRDEYGLDAKIQVFGGDFTVPELDTKTLYIGLAPAIRIVEMRFPPMMHKALGQEFIDSLETTFILPSFDQGDWPMALQEVLAAIYQKLDSIGKESIDG